MANVNGTCLSPFQNPHRQPLEELELTVEKDGETRKVPALSKEWCENRKFLRYEAPQIYDMSGSEIPGAKDRWLELIGYVAKDFEWLLRQPFYKFWASVLHERSIGESLIAFLQESPTFYNLELFPNDAAMRELLERLARDVLVVFARLVITKETKEEFLSHEKHGQILYDEYLITIPIILDICQLYGRENRKVVEKIIATAVKLEPAYNDDLHKTADFLTQVFKTIQLRFEDRSVPLAAGAVPLSSFGSTSHVINLESLEDLVVHLLDVSSNISVFLEVYPPARDFLNTEDFLTEVVHTYGDTIPQMYKRLDALAFKDETLVKYTELKHYLDVTRFEMLNICRTITYHDIARILDHPNPLEVPGASKNVEQFVSFIDRAVAVKEFLIDYHANFPIDEDLNRISESGYEIDSVKENYIKRLLYAEFVQPDQKASSHPRPTNNATNFAAAGTSSSSNQVELVSTNDAEIAEAKNEFTAKSGVELDSLISRVKDILCELGEGFIEKCLKHYNYDPEAVINSFLEDSLPESLKTLDKTLPYIPPDPTEPSAAIDRVLGAERLNVFDNDEFDVMTRDNIDTARVHKGKRKDKYKNLGQLLDDKSYRKDAGHIYEKFSIIQDEYEDEYDDTYESHDVGLRGADDPIEMDGRAFTTPRVLRWNDKREPDAEEDEEEEAEIEADFSSRPQNARENFVQDPAELRARAEQRRLSKRGMGQTRGNGGSKGPQVDLVGKPKGQGNDKNVLANRDKKNTHKASRANHNRRSGAEHKRRQGMVPS